MVHLTITIDGNTIVNTETRAIIGAYDAGDKTTGFGVTDGATAFDLVDLIDSVETAVDKVTKDNKAVAKLRLLKELSNNGVIMKGENA